MKLIMNFVDLVGTYNREILIAVAVLCLIYLLQDFVKASRQHLPPGPWGLPIVGYLPYLSGNSHLDFIELAKKYGDVFRIKLGSLNVVVLNDAEAIKDALSNQELLAKPPGQIMELIIGNSAFFGSDLHLWKEQRKFVVQSMKDLGMGKTQIESDVQGEILYFLEVLQKHGGEPLDLNPRLAPSVSNNISAMVFGKRLEYEDPTRQMVDKCLDQVNDAFTQTSYIGFFPWILKIPFLIKIFDLNRAVEGFSFLEKYTKEEIENHRKTFDKRFLRDFIDKYFIEFESKRERNQTTTFSEEALQSNVLDIFAAGSETVKTALLWIIYIMAAFPEVQRRVQKEILDVIGSERFPEYADRKSMPYTHSVIMEVLRWRTILPLSLMRYALTDVKISGYDVPKGYLVIANFWNIHHDPRYWEDPDSFRPERFLNAEGTSVVTSSYYMPFSMGRRVCPGETMAAMELFLYLTSMLQRFDVIFPGDTRLKFEGKFAISYRPDPYKVRVLPRSY